MVTAARVNVIDGGDVVDIVAATVVAVVVEEECFHPGGESDHPAELADAAWLPHLHRRG